MSIISNDEVVNSCPICAQPAQTLLLCDLCAAAAQKLPDLVPEQITMSNQGGINSCLVDAWGRVFRLAEKTEIGREPAGYGITIHQGSVSRKHARLEFEASGTEGAGTVYLHDLGSTNGSVVANRSVRDSMELVTGDLVFIGSVGFYYLTPVPPLPMNKLEVGTANLDSEFKREGDEEDDDFVETTNVHEPEHLKLRAIEATGGGGGYVCIGDQEVQVSMVQLELLQLLVKRMLSDRARPVAVRGYVHSSEILAVISWDTAHPSDNHVKQLVRRLRRSLARSGRDDLIESQQGLGYRLSVIPR